MTLIVAISDLAPLEDFKTRVFIIATLFTDAEAILEKNRSLEMANASDYEIVDRREGASTILQRPQEDWGSEGEIDQIRFIQVFDKASRQAMVETEEAHLSYVVPTQ